MRKVKDIIKDIEDIQEKIDTVRLLRDQYRITGDSFYGITLDRRIQDSLYHVKRMTLEDFNNNEDRLMKERAKLITELVESCAR